MESLPAAPLLEPGLLPHKLPSGWVFPLPLLYTGWDWTDPDEGVCPCLLQIRGHTWMGGSPHRRANKYKHGARLGQTQKTLPSAASISICFFHLLPPARQEGEAAFLSPPPRGRLPLTSSSLLLSFPYLLPFTANTPPPRTGLSFCTQESKASGTNSHSLVYEFSSSTTLCVYSEVTSPGTHTRREVGRGLQTMPGAHIQQLGHFATFAKHHQNICKHWTRLIMIYQSSV